MPLNFPDRCPLVFGPTPVVRAQRTSRALGIDLWVKRDDMTGVAESGNKIRKLEFLVAEAQTLGADVLVTCGGVNSNHARSTAVVAARLGLRSHLVLRGQDRRPPRGNLLINRMLRADITFIDASQWEARNEVMADLADQLRATGKVPYVIPEGGSNALGSLGYAAVVPELLTQVEAAGGWVRRIVHATGSGGTTAGLALGLAAAGRLDVEVVAVAVCNDRPYFDGRIHQILDDAVAQRFVDDKTRQAARWTILEGYKGSGYARTTPEEMAEHSALAETEGLFVDPVYTGKAFRAIRAEADAGRWRGGATVFLHTGGIFELFAYGREIDALDG